MGDTEKAMVHLTEAEKIETTLGTHKASLASIYLCLGLCYTDHTEAETSLQKSQDLFTAVYDGADHMDTAVTFTEMGNRRRQDVKIVTQIISLSLIIAPRLS